MSANTRVIYIWPDTFWCEHNEVAQYPERSDDYEAHFVPDDFTYEECDDLAQERMS